MELPVQRLKSYFDIRDVLDKERNAVKSRDPVEGVPEGFTYHARIPMPTPHDFRIKPAHVEIEKAQNEGVQMSEVKAAMLKRMQARAGTW